MPKLIWEKKLQEAVKRQQRFGWSVRNMRGKVFVQRYYPDINKKYSILLKIIIIFGMILLKAVTRFLENTILNFANSKISFSN